MLQTPSRNLCPLDGHLMSTGLVLEEILSFMAPDVIGGKAPSAHCYCSLSS